MSGEDWVCATCGDSDDGPLSAIEIRVCEGCPSPVDALDQHREALMAITDGLRAALPGCPDGTPLVVYAASVEAARIEATASLVALIKLMERIGGYLTGPDQATLTEARRIAGR